MADTSWCNDEQAAQDAMSVLRLLPGDLDEDRVKLKATVACGLIAQHLDRADDAEAITDAVQLALLRDAHGKLTTELYLRKDAHFGVMNAYVDEDQAFRIGSDPLAGIRHLLIGAKAQWGLA